MNGIRMLLLLCLLLSWGCTSKRSSQASKEIDQFTMALNTEADADGEALLTAALQGYSRTATNYSDFQYRQDQAAIKTLGDPKQILDTTLQAERAKVAREKKIADSIAEFRAIAKCVDDKRALAREIEALQFQLHDAGFSPEQSAAVARKFGELIVRFTGLGGTQRPSAPAGAGGG